METDNRVAVSTLRAMDGEPAWMAKLRRTSFDEFLRMSWPTPQDEEWRRTDVTALDFTKYRLQNGLATAAVGGPSGVPHAPASGQSGLLRFDAGHCVEARLSRELADKGVRFLPLSDALESAIPGLEALFARSIGRVIDRFQAWHYSQWGHGALLFVPESLEIKEPFFVEFHESGEDAFSAPHLVVILERGARALVVERTTGEGELLCNEGADLQVGDAGALELVRVQQLDTKSRYFGNTFATVSRDASLKHLEVAFGSRLHKSRLDCTLDGAGSDVHLNGIYFAHKKQHMDIGTIQRHNAPHANSRAFYRGAVRDKARTIYQGLIEVGRNAEKTDAYLTNKNLILNDGARSDSIPMLKINTNDVKCSHGSTTGRINELERFYLMSRGFPKVEAEKLLIAGYFEDLIQQVHESLQEELRSSILARLQ